MATVTANAPDHHHHHHRHRGLRDGDFDDLNAAIKIEDDNFGGLKRRRSRRNLLIQGKAPTQDKKPPFIPDAKQGQYIELKKGDVHETKDYVLGVKDVLVGPKTSVEECSKRGLSELDGYGVVRMGFTKAWPDAELSDAWYEYVWYDIFLRTQSFTNKYFKFGNDISECSWGNSLWLDGASQQFLYYAKQVARQDNKTGGWEALLQKDSLRPLLVQGIIGRVLQTSVFEKLLFGCSAEHEAMLEKEDDGLVTLEGFLRTDLRSQVVRACLQRELVTPNFWACVDALTLKLTKLFLPLVGLMRKHFSDKSKKYSLREFHQDLHQIVAEAAYLSLGIRQSSNIFRISMPLPGQQWDLDQNHADGKPFEDSSAAAKEEDAVWLAKKRAEANPARDTPKKAPEEASTAENTHSPAKGIKEESLAPAPAPVPVPFPVQEAWIAPRPRMAYVQIAVWPMFQRFSHGGTTRDPKDEVKTRLCQSQVVYYSGLGDLHDEEDEKHPTLDTYIQKQRLWRLVTPRQSNFTQYFLWLLRLVVFGFALFALCAFFRVPVAERGWARFWCFVDELQALAISLPLRALGAAQDTLGESLGSGFHAAWNRMASGASYLLSLGTCEQCLTARCVLPGIFTLWAATWSYYLWWTPCVY